MYNFFITVTTSVPIVIGVTVSVVMLLLALGLLVTGICWCVWKASRGTKIKKCVTLIIILFPFN